MEGYKDTIKKLKDKNSFNIQMNMGKKVEEEHKDTYNYLVEYVKNNGSMPSAEFMYESIAKDHLKEFDNYYTGLAEMEKKLKEKKD